MFGLFRKRVKRATFADLAKVGVRTESDADYRREQINTYAALMANQKRPSLAELEAFLDLWYILKVEDSNGPAWLPFPGWDSEPLLTRDTYPSFAEAVAAVALVGGDLRPMRGCA